MQVRDRRNACDVWRRRERALLEGQSLLLTSSMLQREGRGFAQHKSQENGANKWAVPRSDQQMSWSSSRRGGRGIGQYQVGLREYGGLMKTYMYVGVRVLVCLACRAEPASHKAQDVPSKGPLVLPREVGSRQLSGMQHMLGERVAAWCRWNTKAMAVFLMLTRANEPWAYVRSWARCWPDRRPMALPPAQCASS